MNISDDGWRQVDDLLFAGLRIRALAELREMTPMSMGDAINALADRQQHLASTEPARFTVPLDGYWDGFYT